MTRQDDDSKNALRQALRSLPRERASRDFAEGVLARRSSPRGARSTLPWQRLAAAAGLAAVLMGGIYLVAERTGDEAAKRHREALRQRSAQLELELARLRRRASRAPTIYLGATPSFDLVVDLAPWMDEPATLPAAYDTPRP